MRFGFDSSSDEEEIILPSLPPLQRSSSSSYRRQPLRRSSSTATPSQPFSPTPVHLPSRKLKLGKTARRSVLLAQSGEDSSGEEEGDSLDELEEDEHEDDSEVDSEEEEWPVGPLGSVGVNGWRRAGKGKARDQTLAALDSGRLLEGAPDAFQQWDEKARANSWATANRTFHLSLSRSIRAPPKSSSLPAGAASPANANTDIASLLSSLTLAQTRSTAALVSSFEARNKSLWADIEASIREAEAEEEGKMKVLEEQRKRGEERERQAREMREKEVARVKKEEEEKEAKRKEVEEREVAERGKKEEEAKERARREAEEAKRVGVTAPPKGRVEGSPQAEWERWTAKMAHIKSTVLPTVSTNPAFRKSCFAAKRAITPKIGQLTSSASATLRIITQLDELLSSLRPPNVDDETASAPYIWTLNHLSKSLIKQAETEVTAKLGTAYPLGRVVVGLMTRGHERLGEVLMARLVKKCFWITGWWPAKTESQTPEQHLKTLGHAPPSAGESLTQYALRQSGLIALYSAILSTSPLAPPQGPCPPSALERIPTHFRPQAGWRLLLLLLRPPLVGLEPTPLLVVTLLEVAGGRLLETYGRQFAKVLECLLREGVRGAKAGWSEKSRSSLVRLELWLEEWEKRGVVERVKGSEVDE